MALVVLGLSHQTAPAEVRERHTFHGNELSEALVTLLDYDSVREAAILSTCNRLELYAHVDETERGIEQLRQFLINFRHGDVQYEMDRYLYTLHGEAVARHLFRVATGLESKLIGEGEILGQVRDAYLRAQEAGCSGPALHRLFQEALNAGKEARTRTEIGSRSLSVATAAVFAARLAAGTLQGARILVVGAGQMGVKAAKRFRAEGVGDLTVANRTVSRAEELVTSLGMGRAIGLADIEAAMIDADVVLTSTMAGRFIIDRPAVERAMARRNARPLCIVDIAVPRNVAPETAELDGVTVIDIDGVGVPVEEALELRKSAVPMVEAIVDTHLERFAQWYGHRETVPVLSALSQRAQAIRESELERVIARCPGLSPRERALITGMGLRIVSKLMHPTFATLREDGTTHADYIDALFGLGMRESDEPVG